jgi:protein required for attachment to host cells
MTFKYEPRTKPIAWILVADRGRARIFETDFPAYATIDKIMELECSQGRAQQRNIVTDRQGYFRGREGSLESGQQQTDFKHQTAEQFAMQIVEFLENGRQQQKFGTLIVIAAPLFLGVLREKLTVPLAHMVTLEMGKDYTQLRPAEIRKHLPETIWT